MGCGASKGLEGPELDQVLSPYEGKWAVKGPAGSICKDGYRDRAEISTDKLEYPKVAPWNNAFILFSKEGCTEVTHGVAIANNPNGSEHRIGVGIGRQAKKRLTVHQAESGEIHWDSFGSHISIPIDEANPDAFTLELQYGPRERKHTMEFQRVNETPNRYCYQLLLGGRLREGTNAVRFTVAASNDAHVGLSGVSASDHGEKYELVLGGWGNTQSVIRSGKQGKELVRADTPNLLGGSKSEARPFWISWSDHHLRVGKGTAVGQDEFMQVPLEHGLTTPFKYMLASTAFGSTGEWVVTACLKDGEDVGAKA